MNRSTTVVLLLAWCVGCAADGMAEHDAGVGATDGRVLLPDGAIADAGAPDAWVPPYPAPADPPDPPTFPDVIGTLSVAVRTGPSDAAATNDPVELCLTADRCFTLNTRDVDDREPGSLEVLHFEGVDLPRSEVDRVMLRTRSTTPDNDRWTPACLSLRFDGEPVYCNEDPGVHIGTGTSAGEVPAWSDPEGLHQACVTCEAGTLTHRPMQGGPATDGLRVWVRTDATRQVGLRLDVDRDLSDAPVVAWAYPRPEDDFTAVLQVTGLRPDTAHWFRVEVDGEPVSELTEARTAPPDDARVPFRIAFGSCSHFDVQPIFDQVWSTDPDLLLMIGDNHYGNTRYLDAQRWNYRRFRGLPERSMLMQRVPTLAIWDDHDFVGNNSDGTCLGRAQALRSFQEYWANPSFGTAEQPGVFFSYRYGPVELFMLDCRMMRPDVGDPKKRCDPDPDAPDLSIADGPLGPLQTEWLLSELEASDADFKLLACGSRWTPNGSIDSWRSFPDARDALFAAMDERHVGGAVLLSGDIHRSEMRWVRRSGSYDIPELTSSPLENELSGCAATPLPDEIACYNATPSFMTIDVDPTVDDPTLTARILDDAGHSRARLVVHRSDLEP